MVSSVVQTPIACPINVTTVNAAIRVLLSISVWGKNVGLILSVRAICAIMGYVALSHQVLSSVMGIPVRQIPSVRV